MTRPGLEPGPQSIKWEYCQNRSQY
jgi:hypothetical protein